MDNRLDLFLQRFFWACIIGIAGFCVHFLQNVDKSVTELNKQVAIVVEKLASNEKNTEKQDQRIQNLENRIVLLDRYNKLHGGEK